MSGPRVLVTGAAGYLGSVLIASLGAPEPSRRLETLLATDIREPAPASRMPGAIYAVVDVRSPAIADLMRHHRIDTVVHLASIVTPGKGSSREFEYSVDVLGTRNVLEASVTAGVRRFIVTSSGAAYGYHADNPSLISEDQPLRGNEEFAYSWHKRLVEEMLAEYRQRHPQLAQVIFRVGTILGDTTRNQITALFERRRLLAIRGSDSPFVFIWDRDVIGCIEMAIFTEKAGIYNVAGDGALSIREIAARLGKPVVSLPAWLLRGGLALGKRLGLTQYGPEQVDFLRYRPVLDNRRLKEQFGYRPQLTSAEVFELFQRSRRLERQG
ncbi:MAG: SDR family oxidoreductase [Hyphomicrobiaceae bacterium]|nr:MAG: SDR family oxidoreductase [Hyphomicrobiaceae bacterium]